MAGARITVRETVTPRLAGIRRALGPSGKRGLLQAIGLAHLRIVDKHFRSESGPDGPWPPLKASTIARRRRGSSRVLQDTGRLRQSFVSRVTGDTVVVGSGVTYSLFHERGTKRLPRRKMLPGRREAEAGARALVEAAIRGGRR